MNAANFAKFGFSVQLHPYNLHTILTHYLSQRILTNMIKGFTESQQLRRYSLLYS